MLKYCLKKKFVHLKQPFVYGLLRILTRKTPSNTTQVLARSDIDIWVNGILNELFIRGFNA